MPAEVQRAPQPARVAGPTQMTPCSSRHCSGSGMNSQMRRKPLIFFSSLTRLHSSQHVLGDTPMMEPLGGSSPLPSSAAITTSSTAQIWCASGAQPGMK